MKLDPSFMLLIFLPALIFESAFNADWHTFTMQFWKILLLAGPMLVASTFLTACAMYWPLGYYEEPENMPFSACVLFGAIISATDPVAVVALLKDLGASKRLATMIEGESLLNDGTAVVLFFIIKGKLDGETITATGSAWRFFWLAGGGVIVGLFFYFLLQLGLK